MKAFFDPLAPALASARLRETGATVRLARAEASLRAATLAARAADDARRAALARAGNDVRRAASARAANVARGRSVAAPDAGSPGQLSAVMLALDDRDRTLLARDAARRHDDVRRLGGEAAAARAEYGARVRERTALERLHARRRAAYELERVRRDEADSDEAHAAAREARLRRAGT